MIEPYDRLLSDAMEGDPLLFARQDEVETAWSIVDPVLARARRPYASTSGEAGGRARRTRWQPRSEAGPRRDRLPPPKPAQQAAADNLEECPRAGGHRQRDLVPSYPVAAGTDTLMAGPSRCEALRCAAFGDC